MSGRKITMNEWDMSDVLNNWNIVFRFDFELRFAFVISKKFELHNELQMWKFKSWVLNLIIKIEINLLQNTEYYLVSLPLHKIIGPIDLHFCPN